MWVSGVYMHELWRARSGIVALRCCIKHPFGLSNFSQQRRPAYGPTGIKGIAKAVSKSGRPKLQENAFTVPQEVGRQQYPP